MRFESKRSVRWAAVLAPAVFAMLLASNPQANSLLEGLKREAENAIKRKVNEATQTEVVECPAGDEKCARKAAKQGKEVRVVQPAAAPASDGGVPALNPSVAHSLDAHPAYVLAQQLSQATSEQEVAELMRTAFDRMNLGIYTHRGQQVLAGAEQKPSDFFLYDFQWKILARAYFRRNDMTFADHTAMLGVAMLRLKDPAPFRDVLPQAIERRYREAAQKPDDPMSFAILLVDGLARHKDVPYELRDMTRYRYDSIQVDPLQSALIMIDFFTRPPVRKAKLSFDWVPSLISTAQAQTEGERDCDLIKGDDAQGLWGRGFDIMGELLPNISGFAGEAAQAVADVTGVTGALADLLVLYGMNITLDPQPPLIHLFHNGYGSYNGIMATVTFDSQGVPDAVLECGWLMGKSMPSNGPMKDVELTWIISPSLNPYLEMHSDMLSLNKIVHTGDGLRTLTDSLGTSYFLMEPSECPNPKGGVLRGQNYQVSVNARYVTRSIPTPGLLGWGLIPKLGPGAIEYLMRGRSAHTRFRAEWHDPPPRSPYGGANQPLG
jgi:hypothetical protein